MMTTLKRIHSKKRIERVAKYYLQKAYKKLLDDIIIHNASDIEITDEAKEYFQKVFKIMMYVSYIHGVVSGLEYKKTVNKNIIKKIKKKIKLNENYEDEEDYKMYMLFYLVALNELRNLTTIFGDTYNDIMMFKPEKEVIKFLDGYSVSLAGYQQQEFLNKVTQVVRDVFEQGMTYEESLKYAKQQLQQLTSYKIKQIIETETTRGYNMGILKETYTSDLIVAYQFEAVLDNRTSDICRSRHGMVIYKTETTLLITNTPPLHVHCRSMLIALSKYDLQGQLPLPKKDSFSVIAQAPYPRNRQIDVDFYNQFLELLGGGI